LRVLVVTTTSVNKRRRIEDDLRRLAGGRTLTVELVDQLEGRQRLTSGTAYDLIVTVGPTAGLPFPEGVARVDAAGLLTGVDRAGTEARLSAALGGTAA
jgi:hypothetical protein